MHKNKNKYIDKLSSQLSTFNDLYTIVILTLSPHDDVIKWKPFPRYWLFVRGIHRSPVNSPHKSQWRGALMFSLMYIWINDWVNTREAGDLRRYRGRYDVTVMDRGLESWCFKSASQFYGPSPNSCITLSYDFNFGVKFSVRNARPCFNIKAVFQIWDSIIKIRQLWDSLIFITGIAFPVRLCCYWDGPRILYHRWICHANNA